MGRYLVRFEVEGDEYFLDWSTVVDAPVGVWRGEAALRAAVHAADGANGLAMLDSRLERCRQKGTSAFDCDSADEVIAYNRAGRDETCLTKEQIISYYCVDGSFATLPPFGTLPDDADD